MEIRRELVILKTEAVRCSRSGRSGSLEAQPGAGM